MPTRTLRTAPRDAARALAAPSLIHEKYEEDFTVIDKNFRLNPLTGAILMMALGASGTLAAAPKLLVKEPTQAARPAQRSVAG
ncbi:protease [Xanthomonas bromi]|uniref:Protease n=1 Tax=Xanthomonas bromi TaxID=56449 RepID=A0A1C3NHA8_9XANT|nr:protease [Xanthomonas bromi]